MPNKINIIGDRYGKCTVLEEVEPHISPNGRKRPQYKCQCDCGKIFVTYGENLRQGYTTSCGCRQAEIMRNILYKHGDTDSRLYNVWSAIKRRCYSVKDPNYRLYGQRGIKMCEDWRTNYSSFREWALNNGYDYSAKRGTCTIDRINNDGDYCPENCRWVNQKTQMNNVSYNHYIEAYGERHTIAEWSDITGIPYYRIQQRIGKYNKSPEEALINIDYRYKQN